MPKLCGAAKKTTTNTTDTTMPKIVSPLEIRSFFCGTGGRSDRLSSPSCTGTPRRSSPVNSSVTKVNAIAQPNSAIPNHCNTAAYQTAPLSSTVVTTPDTAIPNATDSRTIFRIKRYCV